MDKNIKLALLGGDARQCYLARELAERGYETAVWGLGMELDIGKAVRCRDALSAIDSASAVILPLPASLDGVSVNCGDSDTDRLKLLSLLDYCEVPIFGGRLGESFRLSASARKRRVIDYFESETLQIKNATPTAEGAIYLAMQNMQKTLCGSRVAVVGYGRIGRMLTCLLAKMGASVTVAARNLRQLAEASSFGNETIRISSSYALGGLGELCEEGKFDVIFNTAPARLFDKEVIEMLPKDILLIDLASVPGGVDFAAAKERGINALWALSLPGKYAPESAGRIIADTLDELFESEGIT
jgi:dipicolinate synthase subunit A